MTTSPSQAGDSEQARLEGLLNEALNGIYMKAQVEFAYNAREFHAMLAKDGALNTARYILQPGVPPDEVIEFYGFGRPDMLVEVLALREMFRPLFTAQELDEAVRRLRVLGYVR
jgi:hypothetical protein